MSHDLTTSEVARQNVLNYRYALTKLEEHLALGGLQLIRKNDQQKISVLQ